MKLTENNGKLLIALKEQLQKVIFNQKQLLLTLENNNLVPDHDKAKPLIFDNKTVPEMKEVLQGEYNKLQNFEVVLAVVGTMKAGKSTTINAIVGREILPNRNRPMTSLPTLIAHKKDQKGPILTCNVDEINNYINVVRKTNLSKYTEKLQDSYKELYELIKNIENGYKFKQEYLGEEAIFSFLANLNDLVRLSRVLTEDYPNLNFPFSAYKEINSLPRIDVEFTELAKQDEQLGNLVLLDTPGPNEANLPELRQIFEQQLKRSSAVMVIMDYTQLKSQADADIREELEKLPKIEKERLFALVNKFDQKTANSDDQAATINIVANDLLRDQINIENIYCISAQDAFLATRIQNYIKLNKDKPCFDTVEWVQDFAKKAYGTKAKRIWDSTELDEIIEDSQTLAIESQMAVPLEKVIQESYSNAPKIAIKSALRDVNYIFKEVENVFSIQGRFVQEVELNENELEQIKQTITQLENDIAELKKNTELTKQDLDSMSDQSIEQFATLFSAIEENFSDQIWQTILDTLQEYKQIIFLEIKETKRIFTLDNDYHTKRAELKKSLEELENNLKEKGNIKLTQGEIKKLDQKIAKSTIELQNSFQQQIKQKLGSLSKEINNKTQSVHETMLQDMLRIESTFGKESIQIRFSPLNMGNIELDDAKINLSLFDISTTKKETYTIITNRVTRAFGRLFGTKWGQEECSETYHLFTLSDLKELVKELSIKNVLTPLKQQVITNLHNFTSEIQKNAEQIEEQAETLINELKEALEAEKLPYAAKQKRKENLNLINIENLSIQKEIEIVEKSLDQVLSKVV